LILIHNIYRQDCQANRVKSERTLSRRLTSFDNAESINILKFKDIFEPLTEVEDKNRIRVDTEAPADENVHAILSQMSGKIGKKFYRFRIAHGIQIDGFCHRNTGQDFFHRDFKFFAVQGARHIGNRVDFIRHMTG
jgi:hypothetical protein